MSSEEESRTRVGKYVAHGFYEVEEGLKPLSEEEDLAYTVYRAEKERKKPRLIRRRGERIEDLTRLYYPFIVKKFRDNYALIFDPNKDIEQKLVCYILDQTPFENILSELENTKEKEFLDKLVSLEKLMDSVLEKRSGVIVREYVVKNLVIDNELVSELKQLFNRMIEYKLPSVKMAIHEIPVEDYISMINELIDEIAETIGYATSIVGRLKKMVEEWEMDISAEYGEKIKEIEQELEKIREEVRVRINELREKETREINSVKKHYEELLSDVGKRIKELENTLKRLEEEERKAKEYGGDLGGIRKKKTEVERELRELRDRHESYTSRLESEISSIKKKYHELVESEQTRIRSLEDQKKSINEELEALIKQTRNRFEKIRSSILKYIDMLKSVEKKIMESAIPLPPGGEGIYWVPFYIVVYVSEKAERTNIVPPFMISQPGRIRAAKIRFFEKLSEYFNELTKLSSDPTYRQWIDEHNLLLKAPLERIEIGLSLLAEKKIIEHKEVKPIVEAIREQIEELKRGI